MESFVTALQNHDAVGNHPQGKRIHQLTSKSFQKAAAGLMLGAMVLWVCALVDVLKKEFPGENEKLMWILIIVLTGWIGALIYWFIGREKGTLVAA